VRAQRQEIFFSPLFSVPSPFQRPIRSRGTLESIASHPFFPGFPANTPSFSSRVFFFFCGGGGFFGPFGSSFSPCFGERDQRQAQSYRPYSRKEPVTKFGCPDLFLFFFLNYSVDPFFFPGHPALIQMLVACALSLNS